MNAEGVRLIVTRPVGPKEKYHLKAGVFTIGADKDNDIILDAPPVRWRHVILSVQPDSVVLENLADPDSVLLGQKPVNGRVAWLPGLPVRIGPFSLALESQAPSPGPANGSHVDPPRPPSARPPDVRRRAIKKQIHDELLKRLDLKRLTASHTDETDLRQKARQTIHQIIRDIRDDLPSDLSAEALAKDVFDEAMGLGPIEDLLADPEITEIMVNGPEQVYVERAGRLHRTDRCFLDDESVRAVIERIVAPIGRRIDESQPYVDARLPDGSRVNAIIPPLSLVGSCLTIRKFSREPFTVANLLEFDTLSVPMAEFLKACVLLRRNIIVSGGTGSGKTTLLNVVSSFIPENERIVTIEDAAELRLTQPHVIRLEARPPNIEGRGAITVRDLVRNALRMRPDRIVVGECRGGEALDMLQAMNTGHEGSLTTVHANSPRDVISRLETMVLMSGMDLPLRAIREQIGSAIHLIVHTARYSDGSRKISRISELVGMEGDSITMQDLFEYTQTGVAPDGHVIGRYAPTGSVPTFVEMMTARGIRLDPAVFDPSAKRG